MIHLDLLEFLPIFPYSELLIWMLPAPNVTDHSYFDSVCLKIFTALSFMANKDFCLLPMYCRLEDFFMLKNPQICTWVLHRFDRRVVRPWIVPNLGMADQELEL